MPFKMKVSDTFYREQMENLKAYNSKLLSERKARLPYLDSQTNVAQRDCYLYFERRHQGPGTKPGSICSYPSKRWKKRPRISPIVDSHNNHVEGYNSRLRRIPPNKISNYNEDYLEAGSHHLQINENSNDSSLLLNTASSLADAEDHVTIDSESVATSHVDDEEMFEEEFELNASGRRKNKSLKKQTRGSSRSKKTEEQIVQEENNKPHQCMYCPKRYKNKPGLKYHLAHAHQTEESRGHQYYEAPRYQSYHGNPPQMVQYRQAEDGSKSVEEASNFKESKSDKQKEPKSLYCDFCLGTAEHNKKTGQSEEMVSCADCIRSAHPTCLQFTSVMTTNVKKYSWQCIECKSCHLCGTSDNDEQLLFCDDCDRGYHMYCLTPPMTSPPDGNWVCSLCGDNK